ncbi:unnamed protein product [Brassicogethes aeneus]|uniref:Uncharacterized protein n=1 Tax=Brassicogethes aeneus TaxID=1431903 RepID=A0A9P0FGJ2_BRAAE|nr:unnamed protein product [Brassicogethes aeneus]
MKRFVILSVVLIGYAFGVPLSEDPVAKENSPTLLKSLDRCILNQGDLPNLINCAASRMLKTIEKANNEPIINVVPGISFVSDNTRQAKQLNNNLNEVLLPTDPNKKTNKLMELILSAANRFLSGKSLKIQLPVISKESIGRAIEEGRGKMKKNMNPWMMGLGATMFTMVPILMGSLSLMATKALMVGKMALVVSAVLFIQMFLTGRNVLPNYGWNNIGGWGNNVGYGGGYGGGYGTNNIGGFGNSPQYPYARSIEVTPEENNEKTATELAYSGH